MTAAQLIQDVIAHNMFIKFIYFMCLGVGIALICLLDVSDVSE